MYNRYIPQPDGSYRRSRVSEQRQCAPSPPPKPPQTRPEPPQPRPEPPKPQHCQPEPSFSPPAPTPPPHHSHSISDFLKQLMPNDFDTGDFIVVLLLLLLAGDCEEDRSTALLTLALYVLM